jgi:hypothetical protein
MLLPAFHLFCLAAVLVANTSLKVEPVRDPLGSHVRGASPEINTVIANGVRRSPTFARLVEQLNDSDVVVYLETNVKLPMGMDGRLVFLTAAGGVRYLHAQVASGLDSEGVLATAAHELQHAVEVATNPSVRCTDTMRALYLRIGVRSGLNDRFDTVDAQVIGRRVRAELL